MVGELTFGHNSRLVSNIVNQPMCYAVCSPLLINRAAFDACMQGCSQKIVSDGELVVLLTV